MERLWIHFFPLAGSFLLILLVFYLNVSSYADPRNVFANIEKIFFKAVQVGCFVRERMLNKQVSVLKYSTPHVIRTLNESLFELHEFLNHRILRFLTLYIMKMAVVGRQSYTWYLISHIYVFNLQYLSVRWLYWKRNSYFSWSWNKNLTNTSLRVMYQLYRFCKVPHKIWFNPVAEGLIILE